MKPKRKTHPNMDDNAITKIVGWPTEPQMAKFRAVAAAAEIAERESCAEVCESKHNEWATRSYPPPKILRELAHAIRSRANP